ncbi:MAG TPA: AI-2E family transporter [Thermoanaerobaculia bacterium]|nr:AI-2E family transporter [Thermoanaerobaculia bacterium]
MTALGNTPLERRPEWRPTGVIFFGLIAALVLYGAFRIVWPFVTPILLGAMVVTLTHSLYSRLRDRLRGHSWLSAIIMLLGITFLLAIPLFLVAIALVHEANSLIESLQSGEARQFLARLDLSTRLAFLNRWIPGFDPATLSPQRLLLPIIEEIPGWVARNGRTVVGGIAGLLIGFFLMLLATYFFYVEGDAIMHELAMLSPLPQRYDREFGMQFKNVIDATFRGYVVTGLASGVTMTLGLVIAHVPAALFWGAFGTILSLLPLVGPPVVWIPAALYLYFQVSIGQASTWQPVVLTIWGLAVIPIVEHVVRPWSMRGKSELPAIPLLFAVFGGMEAFGFIGLVIGPLVFSLLMSIVDIYKRSFQLGSQAPGVGHQRVPDRSEAEA